MSLGFKKFGTHMQNWLPSSTENSYREEERDSRGSWRLAMNQLANSIQIGIKILIFQKISFSSKFCSAAARPDFSHLGTLLKLRNLRKCIIRKFLALILTASFQIGIQYLLFPKIILRFKQKTDY